MRLPRNRHVSAVLAGHDRDAAVFVGFSFGEGVTGDRAQVPNPIPQSPNQTKDAWDSHRATSTTDVLPAEWHMEVVGISQSFHDAVGNAQEHPTRQVGSAVTPGASLFLPAHDLILTLAVVPPLVAVIFRTRFMVFPSFCCGWLVGLP